jgi:hypothetical protein
MGFPNIFSRMIGFPNIEAKKTKKFVFRHSVECLNVVDIHFFQEILHPNHRRVRGGKQRIEHLV